MTTIQGGPQGLNTLGDSNRYQLGCCRLSVARRQWLHGKNTMSHVLANPPSALLRPADLLTKLPYKSQTTVWLQVKSKELPEPIKIGPRAVAWHAHEIEAIVAARAAGASTEEIQALVVDLTAARQAAWQRVRASVPSAKGVEA